MAFERVWHKSYAPGVPPAIEPERITMAEALHRTAARFPERTAFYFMGRKISFRELESLVNRFARALAALGVRAGDKVATLLPLIDKTLLLTVRSIGALYSRVKGYFPSKIRRYDRV